MTHPMLLLVAEQFTTLPILASPSTCTGKTYIITGANTGLGLETARHLVSFSAARVILAVRNLDSGAKAQADIEKTTGRTGVVEVWKVDLAEFASVRSFAERVKALERVDGFVNNAGVFLDKWSVSEGDETTMTVNVVSTMLLGALVMPKLVESARRFGIRPRMVFVVSALGFTAKGELDKGGKVDVFEGLNDEKKQAMDARYALTKLVEMYAVREFAAKFPVKETGVIINMTSPGLCTTQLGRDARTLTRAIQGALRTAMARSAEEGSRTILHGIVGDEETHGKHLSGCEIKEHWIPKWMTDEEGQRTQKQIWKELVAKLVQAGCTTLS
ncbi:hypothetical protein B0T16DRAFT_514950 [Cercophora newfieldiana]|uniref:Ketoreductase domain-containing protein n=1 Tax=Cercophora newfieldiana TaxID=92897 RepID=A0AA40CJQ8_9PEZI|nr:hypothetical protein B0T16DRAFT_514950 [Cercophora newfieldiana]